MQFALNTSNFGGFGDPRVLAQLAHEAEQSGWDGFFLWDHILFHPSVQRVTDPWIALAAIAMSTEHIRIGTMITPLSRRRPWKVARETTSLDHLSNGRVILGVGLGDPVEWEFTWFNEQPDPKVRAQMLDEGLDILAGLWSGQPFNYNGEHYQLHEMTFTPTPVQSPRIPVWVGGYWPNKRPMRRAARWDGICIGMNEKDGEIVTIPPHELREAVAYIKAHRTSDAPFEVAVGGSISGDEARDAETLAAYIEAGATWWLEDINPWRGSLEQMRQHIRQGPPKL